MKAAAWLLAALYVALYLLPLGMRPMVIPDEPRYAEIPREMLATGNWAVPRLNGLRYFEKPVLGYWLNAGAQALFGRNAWAARLPSALAAGCAAALVGWLLWRFRGDRRTAGLAVLVLLTGLQFFGMGVYNTLDGPLNLFLTAALAMFFLGYSAGDPRRRRWLYAACGVAAGLAFLTKGFLACAIPVVVVGPFVLWERRWREALPAAWIAPLAALLVALPWGIVIAAREPDYWHYFFWIEHVKRFSSSDAQHAAPVWYYLPVLLAGGLPWTLQLPAAATGLHRAGWRDSLVRFAVCWLAFPVLFFSISRGKLPTYILPCYPPLALLIAAGLREADEPRALRLFSISAWVSAGLGVVLTLALGWGQAVGWGGKALYATGEGWKAAAAGMACGVWAALSLTAACVRRLRLKIVFFGAAPLLLLFYSHFLLPQTLVQKKAPGDFYRTLRPYVRPDTILVTDDYSMHAVCWFFQRHDALMMESKGEVEYGLSYPDAAPRHLTFLQFWKLVGQLPPGRNIAWLTDTHTYQKNQRNIPPPTRVVPGGKFVMVEYEPADGPPQP